MKLSKLKNIIKEQIKKIDQSKEKVTIKFPPAAPIAINKKHMGSNPSNQPSDSLLPSSPSSFAGGGGSSSAIAYYLCGNITHPHGTGQACYGFNQFAQWTSPYSGATVTDPTGGMPWFYPGGQAYLGLNNSDFPIMNGGTMHYAPPQRACNDYCLQT
jgi:hypothetical protein